MKATETLIYTNTATNQSVSISFLSNLIPTAFDEDVDASFYTDKNLVPDRGDGKEPIGNYYVN